MSIIQLIDMTGNRYFGPGKKRELEKFLTEKGFKRTPRSNSWTKDPYGNTGLVQCLLLPVNPLKDFPESPTPL